MKREIAMLLLEKPMATSLHEGAQILRMAKKRGVRISVNHQMRFMPQYQKIKKYLNSIEFGGLSCMTVVGGNFGLAMNGIHYFEAFRFMTDEKPRRVMAWLDRKVVPNPRGKQFKDRSGCVIVETKSGKRLILQCSIGQGHGIQVTYAARNGWISVDELTGRVQASVRQAKFRGEPTTRYALPARNWSEIIRPAEILDSTAAVVRALLKDKNRVTGEDGLLAMKVLVAAHMSAERGGRPIFINGRLDLRRKFAWA
jgi:predicted dehydrogenase